MSSSTVGAAGSSFSADPSPWGTHPLCRVRRCCCQHPLPSELHGRHFDACSSSIEQRPSYETRLPHWTWGQPGRYGASAGYRDECRGGGGRTSVDRCDPSDRSALPPSPVG